MYTMLIVDDEEIVVEGLAADIDWSDLPLGDIFTATDPMQAIAYLENNRIDLLVADIKMPKMDGLELMAKVRKRWPMAKVILLSGYGEFAYAQKAIELDVFAYLTKPTAYEVIKETVGRAIREVEAAYRREEMVKEAHERLERAAPILVEHLLTDIVIHGSLEARGAQQSIDALGTGLRSSRSCFLLAVRIDSHSADDRARNDVDEVLLGQLCSRLLLGGKLAAAVRDWPSLMLFIVQGLGAEDLSSLHKGLEEMAEKFQETVRASLGITTSIFWGEILPSLDGIHESYNRLLGLMRRSIGVEIAVALQEEQHEKVDRQELRHLYEHPSLVEVLRLRKSQEWADRINRLFDEIPEGATEQVVLAWHAVTAALIQVSHEVGIPVADWAGGREALFYGVGEVATAIRLREQCMVAGTTFMEHSQRGSSTRTHALVARAKEVAQELLGSQFTVADIARALAVHRSYLSSVFKVLTGQSLIDYVTDLKIEKAKQLLMEPGMKSYEVAEKLGYLSVPHFTSLFRRRTGMTPAQYRIRAS